MKVLTPVSAPINLQTPVSAPYPLAHPISTVIIPLPPSLAAGFELDLWIDMSSIPLGHHPCIRPSTHFHTTISTVIILQSPVSGPIHLHITPISAMVGGFELDLG